MSTLWSRIRTARLFQVVAVYLGASWVLLQIADVLVESLSLPAWVEPVALLLLLIGLLVIATTAWLQAHPPAPPESDGRVTTAERVVHQWVLPHFTWRRAILGGVVAFMLLGGAAGVYRFSREPGSFLAERASAHEAGVGIAVLPFSVTGGDDLEVWREGMLDLLATNLDGVGGLRTIDPRTMMARLRELDAAGPDADLRLLLEAGRRANARYALLGSVVALGSSVRLSAELHDLEGDGIVARAQAQGRAEDILTKVDELSVEIMRRLLAREDGPLPGLRSGADGVTTSSLEAMKAFLEGEALYRNSRMEEAVNAYERAVAADSTFALAYWGLSWAWAWRDYSGGEPSMNALDRALALEHRLPPRIASVARADFLRRRGRLEAIPMLEGVVRRYPDDAEAHYLLAESYFHLGDQAVMPLDRSEEAFLRAIDLDPSVAAFYFHILPIAIARGDTSGAVALMDRLARSAADTTRLHRFRTMYELLYGPAPVRDSIGRALIRSRNHGHLGHVLRGGSPTTIGVDPGARALQEWERLLASAVEAGAEPPEARAEVLFALGRYADAFEALRDARPSSLGNERYPVAQVLYEAHRQGATVPESLARRHLDAAGGATTDFFVAAYAADAGDWDAVARVIEMMERRAADLSGADSSEAGPFASMRDALVGLRQWKRDGRRAEAIATLERVRSSTTSMWRGGVVQLNAVVRSWLADLYLEADRPADAERYLRSLWVPYTDYRLAVQYDRQGRSADARRHYAAFMEKWRDADPDLPQREHALGALARLSSENSN